MLLRLWNLIAERKEVDGPVDVLSETIHTYIENGPTSSSDWSILLEDVSLGGWADNISIFDSSDDEMSITDGAVHFQLGSSARIICAMEEIVSNHISTVCGGIKDETIQSGKLCL